jgi:hypothetical protein
MNNGVQAFDKENFISALGTNFCITENFSMPPDYKINLHPSQGGHYRFTDANGSTYALRAMHAGYQYLRYISAKPAIVKVEVEYSMAEN